MELVQIIVLAIVQGLTEFLPVSSSAHLILFPHLVGWDDQGLAFDVAVHLGTLAAVVWYFRQEVFGMTRDWFTSLGRRERVGDSRLAWAVILGTIPVGIAGLLFKGFIEVHMRSPLVIAWATIGFGVVLFIADRSTLTFRRIDHMTFAAGFFIGLSQVLALIPGTSRSGITMTAARALGFERVEAARFSLLLAIPAILGAGSLAGYDLYESGNMQLGLEALVGAALSFGVALLAIVLMIGWLRRASFTPFVIYRIVLGSVLLWWVYGTP